MAAQYYDGHHTYDGYSTYPPRNTAAAAPYPEAPYPPQGPAPTARGAVVSRFSQDDPDESFVEEIHREFPPGTYYDRDRHRGPMADIEFGRSRSVGRSGDYHYYRDEDFARGPRHYRHRHRKAKYETSSSTSSSPSPTRRRRKSLGGQAVGALTGAAAALGLTARSRSRHRHHDHYDDDRYYRRGRSYSRSRSRSRRHRSLSRRDLGRTLTAALTAGAAEAYRARKEPGGWNGEKGKRIMTAALTAGGIDTFLEQGSDNHKKRHILESTLAGLATNHLVNGPRSRSRSRRRTRSESRGGFKDIASTGILAAAGREAYKRYQSRSRSRARRSYDGSSSDDEYRSRSRRRGVSRKRSHSVSAYVSKGLSALGLTDGHPRRGSRSRSRGRHDYSHSEDSYRYPSRSRSRSRHSRLRSRSRGRYDGNYVSPTRSLPGASRAVARRQANLARSDTSTSSSSSSDSDLGSSTDEERKAKKLRRRRLLTTAFAGIATAHAGHNLVENVEKRKKRIRQLKNGEISQEEAENRKMKDKVGDLASLGLLAWGLKGVVGEWKAAAKQHKEWNEFRIESQKRAAKRELRRARSFQGS